MAEALHENPLAFFQKILKLIIQQESLFNTLCAFREINTSADANDAFFFSFKWRPCSNSSFRASFLNAHP